MINGIIGKKLGMTQVYSPNGKAEPVTVLEVGPCTVTQVKTQERDGYSAAQLGFGAAKKLAKAEKGHLKELGDFRHLREFRLDDATGVEVGAKVDACLPTASSSTSPASPKATVSPAASSATASTAVPRLTARATATGHRARSAPRPRRAAFTRARVWQGTWAMSRLQYRA